MKSVLFVVPRFHTNLYFATRMLAEAGYRVHVFANERGALEEHGIVAPRVFGRNPDPREVAEAWREAAPDLVLIRLAGTLSEQIGRLARRAKAKAYAYSLKPLTTRDGLRSRLRRALRGEPRRRVTPVPGLDRTLPPDPLATLLPWPVMRLDGKAPGRDPAENRRSELRILCIGKLAQPRKNQDKIIEAIKATGLDSSVHLTLVGTSRGANTEAERQHQRRLIEAADLPWISISSDVPFAEMGSLYAGADICVLPSVGEPLGVAPLEAMAYGAVPVISAQAGSAGFLEEGENGVVVDMERPESLPAALAGLVRDRDRLRRLSAGAARTARTELGRDLFLRRIESLM